MYIVLFDIIFIYFQKEKCLDGSFSKMQCEIAMKLCKYVDVTPNSFIKNENLLEHVNTEISKIRVKSANK